MNEVKYEYTTWKGDMPQSHLQTLASYEYDLA